MDTNTLDTNTITLMVTILGSWMTLVGLIIFQYTRLDSKIDTKFGHLDTRVASLETAVTALDGKVDALDDRVDGLGSRFDKLDGKFDSMGRDVSDARERLARIEGHLMGPESFRMRGPQSPAGVDPSPDDPPGGHRQAS